MLFTKIENSHKCKMTSVITLTIGYNRAVNPRRFRCMDSRCESKFPTSNGLLLLELTTIAVRM